MMTPARAVHTAEGHSIGRRIGPGAAAAAIYACLVLIMWGAYNPHSGMSYETMFPYMSETGSAWKGFFYMDPLRIHTSTFYHLSYLIGEVLRVRGS